MVLSAYATTKVILHIKLEPFDDFEDEELITSIKASSKF